MRIVLVGLGGFLGIILSSPGMRLFGTLIGASIGFAIADLVVLRGQIESLATELKRLKSEVRSLRDSRQEPSPREASPQEDLSPPPELAAPERPARSATPAPAFGRGPGLPVGVPRPPMAPTPAFEPRPRAGREPPLIAAIRRFFTGGNTLVRVGVIILLFGVAFLLRFMAEHTHVPVELRLSAIIAAAIALLVFGWRLRGSRPGYALAVQGGAVGILYLTIFAALRLYRLIPVPLAFALLAGISVLSAALAVLQNSQSFGLLAVSGGFLAPILASTGQGSYIELFSYYAVLNTGILAISWFKAWRPLNVAGFVFTFAIGAVWGMNHYKPDDFAATESFLILFFSLYFAISILFSARQPANFRGYVDGTLVFGTPLIAFGLQAAMLHDRLLLLAFSALALSALYLSTAWLLKRRRERSQQVLFEAFMALGVVFSTVAIPLALDVKWNVVTWGLEGAALIWVGCRQNRMLSRLFGALLLLASGCLIAAEFKLGGAQLELALERYYGLVSLAAACAFSAWTLFKHRELQSQSERLIAPLLFWWGLGWWLLGGITEIVDYFPHYARAASLAFFAASALISSELHRGIRLTAVKAAALLLLPVMVVYAFAAFASETPPFALGGYLSWPFTFVVWYWIMHRHEGPPGAPLANWANTVTSWHLCVLSSWQLAHFMGEWVQGGETWAAIAWTAVPTTVLYLMPRLVTRISWPFLTHRGLYLFTVGTGLAIYLGAWSVFSNLHLDGNAEPLPYLPLVNPLDIAQALVLLALTRYWRFLRPVRSPGQTRIDQRLPLPMLVTLAFLWLNGILLRTLHLWFGVPFELTAMMESTLVQTSLSIFWAGLALTTMLIAARKRSRVAWLTGAALMVIVIAKLFLVDLSRVGSIERIVSFVGVGLLMLIVGYFSPLPPAEEGA